MKKLVYIIIGLLLIVGCSGGHDYSLGVYKDRNYKNHNFKVDLNIPEHFSYLNQEELANVNKVRLEQSQNQELAKYHNLVLSIEHLDKTKLISYVDSHPDSHKHKEKEANQYLDFLSESDITYRSEKSFIELNGIEYVVLDLIFDFNQAQKNLFTVINNKLMTIQITYNQDNAETALELLSLYE